MKFLILSGAGTSVELGVPAMYGMAIEFVEHAKQWGLEHDLVEQLIGNTNDIEHLIENLDRIAGARDPLTSLGNNKIPLDKVDTLRAEVEWFVQHAAERIVARDAQLMWGAVLRQTRNHELSFVTTNYDRAIELAANAEGIELNDGFSSFSGIEISDWVGFAPKARLPLLAKLHGSTDWYADVETGSPVKLRHPMPLFGRAALEIRGGKRLGSALVLPSREKLLTRRPYPRLSQAFLGAGDTCDAAAFVGTSLRDPHLRDAAESVAARCPTFIVGPSGATYGVPKAIGIAEPASRFLMSTLPKALLGSDPVDLLSMLATTGTASDVKALQLLKVALDPAESSSRRCEAIERLDSVSFALDGSHIRQLVDDPDATIARYSLGLASISPHSKELCEDLKTSAHIADPLFAEEYGLLEKLLRPGSRDFAGAV